MAVIEGGGFYDRRISKRTIGKVRKDGKFFLARVNPAPMEEPIEVRMWTPERFGDPKASVSGDKGHYRPHVELWTEKHDAELAFRQKRNATIVQRNKLKAWVDALDARDGIHQLWIDKLTALANELSGGSLENY